jgi:hypothetical protein
MLMGTEVPVGIHLAIPVLVFLQMEILHLHYTTVSFIISCIFNEVLWKFKRSWGVDLLLFHIT